MSTDSRHHDGHDPSPRGIAGLIAGPVLALLTLVLVDTGSMEGNRTAAVAVLMAVWWITEAIPLAATALLPLALFPTLGVSGANDVSKDYVNWIIFLFIGGFLVAIAMQRWNLHRRLALNVLLVAGGKPTRIVLGFMASTAFLSMWISNTATTMMMVPIGLAVILNVEERFGPSAAKSLGVPILLGTAYAASIGGIATLVGTPPNGSLAGIFEQSFPDRDAISFAPWMFFALPLSLLLFAVAAVYLVLLTKSSALGGKPVETDLSHVREELKKLGPMAREERMVAIVFVSLALAWLFRSKLELGFVAIPGWSSLLTKPEMVNDGTVAMIFALLLFLLPARQGKARRLLETDAFGKLPWGIVVLFGGGFALAGAFQDSGLSLYVGEQLAGLKDVHPIVLVAVICVCVTFLTELTSNTASAQILLPLLASLAAEIGVDPLLLMVPAAVSCSCAFMLPVATPPNAIAFGSQRLTIGQMLRAGLILNLAGVLIVVLATFLWGGATLGIAK